MEEKMVESLPQTVERKYKDTLFRMIFRQPNELLSLYNAIHETDYTDTGVLEIVTLENAIYMNVKNDLACIVDCKMDLYEHQASVNPNMPLRDLFYVSAEYRGMVGKRSLYSRGQVEIPPPLFIVFYNGIDQQPERKVMKLSDLYRPRVEKPNPELEVLQLNISEGYNQDLKEKCPTLLQYSQYVSRVQTYARDLPLQQAVERAVDECIREGILADFLRKYKEEAIEVCIFEYDEEVELEKYRIAERELAREEVREEVRDEVREEILQKLLKEKIDVDIILKTGFTMDEIEEAGKRLM